MATNKWATLLELQWLQPSKLVGQHFLEWQWQQTNGQRVLHIMGANGYIKKDNATMLQTDIAMPTTFFVAFNKSKDGQGNNGTVRKQCRRIKVSGQIDMQNFRDH
jgi:hypothetical protein